MSKLLGDVFDHNDNCIAKVDESFVGYGEDESTPTATNTALRKPLRKELPQIFLERNGDKDGDTGLLLRKVVDKFLVNTGLRPGLELPERETIVQALHTVLQNVNKDDDLWEWLEESSQFNTAELLFAPNSLETSSQRGSMESSSLGLLSYSDLSSFSFSSHDMMKEQENNEPATTLSNHNNGLSDPVELLCEIEELQHQNRKLSEENGRLQKQVTQTEDANSLLFNEKELLEKNRLSLQAQAERKRELEREAVVLKVALTSLEELNARLQEQIATQEKDKALLEVRIQDLHDELCGNQSQIELWRQRVEELGETLLESKVLYGSLKSEHEACCQSLKLKTTQLQEKEQFMQELITSTEILKQQKNDLEVQLCRAEQEIACLQHAARRVKSLSADLSTTEIDLNTSCEASHILETSSSTSSVFSSPPVGKTSPPVPIEHRRLASEAVLVHNEKPFPVASTPQKALLVRKLSLCAEMRNVVRQSGGELPSPFCGKHILPQALYDEMNGSVPKANGALFISVDSPIINGLPKLNWQIDSSQDQLYQEKHLSGSENADERCQCHKNVPGELTNDEKDQSISGCDFNGTCPTLTKACAQLREVNESIKRINSDTVSVLNPFPGCVISEPEAINNNMVSEEKDPLNMELRLLRSHIANTQAILTYLSKNQKDVTGISLHSVLQEVENTCNRNINKGGPRDTTSLLHHLSSDMLQQQFAGKSVAKPFWMLREHIRDGSTTTPSQRSTPLHHSRWLTRSCPNIPSIPQSFQLQPSTHRGTQTEYSPRQSSAFKHQAIECANSPLPRNRSSSFVAAITESEERASALVNDGVTVQTLPNREVLIVKDSVQDGACTVHAIAEEEEEDEEEEPYRETDFDDVYQEFRQLRHGEENLGWEEPIPLRRSQSEEAAPHAQQAARKRRRSFSEHNTNYSQAIDLDLEGHEEEEEEEEEESPLFETEEMACRVEAARPSAQQTFRPVAGLLGSVVGSTAAIVAPTSTSSNGNPMLGLSARVQQPIPAPAALVLLGQRPEKSLVSASGKLRRGPCGGAAGDLTKGRFLMPDVMENSETESAKDSANGSMESEGPPPGTGPVPGSEPPADGSFVVPPPAGSDPAFPSLPDDFLKRLGLEKDSPTSPEDLTGREVECKFSTLSLAFKTDKFTLGKRLELQQRQRDTAEKNIDSEVIAMREVLNSLNQLCGDSQMRDLITKLQHHLDIVQQSTSRMSSRAEVFGAVQQEFRARVNSAVGSLVSSASTARLERILMTGRGSNGSPPPVSSPATTSSVVFGGGTFTFPPASASAVLQSGNHARLSPRNSAEGSPEPKRDETSSSTQPAAPSGEQERNQERVQPQGDRIIPKGGFLGEQAPFLAEEDESNLEVAENSSHLALPPASGGRLSPTPSNESNSSRQHSSCSGESNSSSCSDHPKGSFLQQILRNSFLRKSRSLLLMWLPDDGWWTQWDVSSTTRALRYGLGSLLFLAALFSLVVTFLPAQNTSLCMVSSQPSAESSGRLSVQEILGNIFGPYIKRKPHLTV